MLHAEDGRRQRRRQISASPQNAQPASAAENGQEIKNRSRRDQLQVDQDKIELSLQIKMQRPEHIGAKAQLKAAFYELTDGDGRQVRGEDPPQSPSGPAQVRLLLPPPLQRIPGGHPGQEEKDGNGKERKILHVLPLI